MITLFFNKLNNLSEEAFGYSVAIFLLFLALISNKAFNGFGSTTILWISLIALEIGFIRYLTPVLQKFWKIKLGKVIISLGMLLGSAFCMSFAGQIINTYLEVTSAPFLYTQTVTSLLISPLVTSIVFGFLSFIIMPFTIVIFSTEKLSLSLKRPLLFWLYRPEKMPNGFLVICRIIAFIGLVSLSWSFNSNNQWFTDTIGNFAKWYAYNFEMEKFSHCSHADKEKIGYINKDDIVVGIDDGKEISFRTSTCSRK